MEKLHLKYYYSFFDHVFVPIRFFWRLYGTNTIQQELIKGFWPEAPDNIDAAFENTVQDRLFLIKGNFTVRNCFLMIICNAVNHKAAWDNWVNVCCLDQKVWAFSAYDLVSGFPKSLSSMGVPAKVKKVSAALYDQNTGKTLYFVDNNYYR